ncbi:type VI secretion system tip protein VgrG, partial [Vibrio kanaloae]|uniref:bacteriophage T4 gp5 trimerisation domain-containing protein n=1 Tax=Vibrio kanaloae TaxID=170673 RepID=UPI00113AB8D6
NGDPDQPIITGRTYNATHTPPYALPEHKTKTVLRSQTHQGEGFNELSFEDQADQELIYIRAQKNMQVEVENSSDTRINYDNVVSVGHNEQRTIAQDRSLKVEGKQQHTTMGDYLNKIEGDEHESVLGDWAKKVAGAVGINADGDITLKSGNKITLQVGGSFVVIDSSGVAIDGAKILIKSGGSPGAIPMPSSPDILNTAAAEGSAFVANCPAE